MVATRTARCPELLWFIELQLLQTSASEIPQCKLLIVNRNVAFRNIFFRFNNLCLCLYECCFGLRRENVFPASG